MCVEQFLTLVKLIPCIFMRLGEVLSVWQLFLFADVSVVREFATQVCRALSHVFTLKKKKKKIPKLNHIR